MKKIAFLSSGCQGGLVRPREMIAANPELIETKPEEADLLMVNLCAMSAENLERFGQVRSKIATLRKANPNLRVLAGGCVTGLPRTAQDVPQKANPAPIQPDLSFADATFCYKQEAQAFADFLKAEAPEVAVDPTQMAPCVLSGAATINIAQGCNRRCAFCKTHILQGRSLKSRPMAEIVELAHKTAQQGVQVLALSAENTTEYGIDIGTNLEALLTELYQIEGIRYLDIYGLCLDEMRPSLLEKLQHEKVSYLQLEVQSLNDQIRRNMHLTKTKDEVLEILDALSDKAILGNLMAGFPGHNIKEFDRELRLAREHHLYFLSFDPYDDTPGVPSHLLYKKPSETEQNYYTLKFMEEIGKERQLLLEKLLRLPFIEALVIGAKGRDVTLQAASYSARVYARDRERQLKVGDVVKVKITGLFEYMPDNVQKALIGLVPEARREERKQTMHYLRYFEPVDDNQFLPLAGQIVW